jgi:triphosphoribosyl-dephospho-CoA synthetase
MRYAKISSAIGVWVLMVMFVTMPAGFAKSYEDNTTVKSVQQEAQDLLEALKDYTADQRDEAIERSKTALDILDRRIDELETDIADNWDQMSSAAREKTRESLKTLRKKRNDVAEKYGSLKASSTSAWEEMKQGFSDAYEDLSDAWAKSVNEFDKNNSDNKTNK